jgi:glucosamine--fructose-6-phosphate aminotransferase (isomerizing)
MEHCSVIGRGYNYSSAFEIALKIKELTGIISEPFSSADFHHGPIATVHENSPVIIIASSGQTEEDLWHLLEEMDRKKAELITITNVNRIKRRSAISFDFSSLIPEALSPITAVIPGQLIALKLALAKGLDPDHPFGLKKVTLTR